MKTIYKKMAFVLLSAFLLESTWVTPCEALKIEITQGQIAAIPIAITLFVDETGDQVAAGMAEVITYDLQSTGLFAPINPAAFIQDATSLQAGPRFADWRGINAQCLLMGRVYRGGAGLVVEFRLFDVVSGTQLAGFSMNAEAGKWRVLAHMVADEVYKRMTGEAGYFNTKIAYIAESGPHGKKRVRRLALMDWDGHGNEMLTDGKYITLTPRISPNNREIVYLTFEDGKPHVYLYDLRSRSKKRLGKFDGMTFAPRFSPDGDTVIMSLAKGGSTALYTMNIRSLEVQKLTNHEPNTIDTSPCYSPDGQHVVFTSDRGGSEQIYVMGRDGSNAHRISFGGGTYSQPVWSPRGDLIAFVKKAGGRFSIGVMRPDGSDERLIAQGFLVELPAWTPNGRVLMYTKEVRTGKGGTHSSLHAVDLTGRTHQKIKTAGESSCGYWSELLSKAPIQED